MKSQLVLVTERKKKTGLKKEQRFARTWVGILHEDLVKLSFFFKGTKNLTNRLSWRISGGRIQYRPAYKK